MGKGIELLFMDKKTGNLFSITKFHNKNYTEFRSLNVTAEVKDKAGLEELVGNIDDWLINWELIGAVTSGYSMEDL